jgi:hypothetical protein
MEEELTRWTIRFALLAYAGRIAAGLLSRTPSASRERQARWLWTIGCVLLWIHVGCAFQFYHHWSHAAALAQTARETAETTGIDWGDGIYFNYLLMLLWGADVLWWWTSPASYCSRPRSIAVAFHAFVAFMAFNATIVFEAGAVRYTGIAGVGVLIVLAIMAHHRNVRRNTM